MHYNPISEYLNKTVTVKLSYSQTIILSIKNEPPQKERKKSAKLGQALILLSHITVMGQNLKKKKIGLEDQNLFTDGNMCNCVLV